MGRLEHEVSHLGLYRNKAKLISSSSGTPYATPAGHTPTWVNSVKWHRASAFEPESYASLIGESTAVVHTLGILLEDAGYKKAVRGGSAFGVGKALLGGLFGTPSPLRTKEERRRGYDGMNRDSGEFRGLVTGSFDLMVIALSVLDTYLSASSEASSSKSSPNPRSFVYISAADCFRPLIPRRYIDSKREAEAGILERCTASSGVQPFFMRPGMQILSGKGAGTDHQAYSTIRISAHYPRFPPSSYHSPLEHTIGSTCHSQSALIPF